MRKELLLSMVAAGAPMCAFADGNAKSLLPTGTEVYKCNGIDKSVVTFNDLQSGLVSTTGISAGSISFKIEKVPQGDYVLNMDVTNATVKLGDINSNYTVNTLFVVDEAHAGKDIKVEVSSADGINQFSFGNATLTLKFNFDALKTDLKGLCKFTAFAKYNGEANPHVGDMKTILGDQADAFYARYSDFIGREKAIKNYIGAPLLPADVADVSIPGGDDTPTDDSRFLAYKKYELWKESAQTKDKIYALNAEIATYNADIAKVINVNANKAAYEVLAAEYADVDAAIENLEKQYAAASARVKAAADVENPWHVDGADDITLIKEHWNAYKAAVKNKFMDGEEYKSDAVYSYASQAANYYVAPYDGVVGKALKAIADEKAAEKLDHAAYETLPALTTVLNSAHEDALAGLEDITDAYSAEKADALATIEAAYTAAQAQIASITEEKGANDKLNKAGGVKETVAARIDAMKAAVQAALDIQTNQEAWYVNANAAITALRNNLDAAVYITEADKNGFKALYETEYNDIVALIDDLESNDKTGDDAGVAQKYAAHKLAASWNSDTPGTGVSGRSTTDIETAIADLKSKADGYKAVLDAIDSKLTAKLDQHKVKVYERSGKLDSQVNSNLGIAAGFNIAGKYDATYNNIKKAIDEVQAVAKTNCKESDAEQMDAITVCITALELEVAAYKKNFDDNVDIVAPAVRAVGRMWKAYNSFEEEVKADGNYEEGSNYKAVLDAEKAEVEKYQKYITDAVVLKGEAMKDAINKLGDSHEPTYVEANAASSYDLTIKNEKHLTNYHYASLEAASKAKKAEIDALPGTDVDPDKDYATVIGDLNAALTALTPTSATKTACSKYSKNLQDIKAIDVEAVKTQITNDYKNYVAKEAMLAKLVAAEKKINGDPLATPEPIVGYRDQLKTIVDYYDLTPAYPFYNTLMDAIDEDKANNSKLKDENGVEIAADIAASYAAGTAEADQAAIEARIAERETAALAIISAANANEIAHDATVMTADEVELLYKTVTNNLTTAGLPTTTANDIYNAAATGKDAVDILVANAYKVGGSEAQKDDLVADYKFIIDKLNDIDPGDMVADANAELLVTKGYKDTDDNLVMLNALRSRYVQVIGLIDDLRKADGVTYNNILTAQAEIQNIPEFIKNIQKEMNGKVADANAVPKVLVDDDVDPVIDQITAKSAGLEASYQAVLDLAFKAAKEHVDGVYAAKENEISIAKTALTDAPRSIAAATVDDAFNDDEIALAAVKAKINADEAKTDNDKLDLVENYKEYETEINDIDNIEALKNSVCAAEYLRLAALITNDEKTGKYDTDVANINAYTNLTEADKQGYIAQLNTQLTGSYTAAASAYAQEGWGADNAYDNLPALQYLLGLYDSSSIMTAAAAKDGAIAANAEAIANAHNAVYGDVEEKYAGKVTNTPAYTEETCAKGLLDAYKAYLAELPVATDATAFETQLENIVNKLSDLSKTTVLVDVPADVDTFKSALETAKGVADTDAKAALVNALAEVKLAYNEKYEALVAEGKKVAEIEDPKTGILGKETTRIAAIEATLGGAMDHQAIVNTAKELAGLQNTLDPESQTSALDAVNAAKDDADKAIVDVEKLLAGCHESVRTEFAQKVQELKDALAAITVNEALATLYQNKYVAKYAKVQKEAMDLIAADGPIANAEKAAAKDDRIIEAYNGIQTEIGKLEAALNVALAEFADSKYIPYTEEERFAQRKLQLANLKALYPVDATLDEIKVKGVTPETVLTTSPDFIAALNNTCEIFRTLECDGYIKEAKSKLSSVENYVNSNKDSLANKAELDAEIARIQKDINALDADPGKKEKDYYQENVIEVAKKLAADAKALLERAETLKYVLGDLTNDGELTTADFVALADIILDRIDWETTGFTADEIARIMKAADLNGDKKVGIGDALKLQQTINGVPAPALAPARTVVMPEFALSYVDGNIALSNNIEVAGMLLDIKGVSEADIKLAARTAGMTIMTNTLSNGNVRVMLINGVIDANTGAVLNVEGGKVVKATVSDVRGREYIVVDGEATAIESITNAVKNFGSKVYSVGGQLMNGLKKGINIIRNADGTSTKVLNK